MAGGEHVREARGVDRAQIEPYVVGAVLIHAIEDRGGELVAGGELVGEASPGALSSVAPSSRRASVSSVPSWSEPGSASAVGWNWQNSRSAKSAPAAWPSTDPAAIAPYGLVVRAHSAPPPPVASTVARAATGPWSVITPAQRSRSLHSAATELRSRTSIRGPACTSSISRSVSALPVALPPAWTIRRAVCPPSSARLPSGSVSKPRRARRAPRPPPAPPARVPRRLPCGTVRGPR